MSNSKLPNGGYTLTNGSNYMLDGFQFDTEYGGGPYEKARLPEAKGLSVLPSGMIPEDSGFFSELPSGVEVESDLDLGEFTKDASDQLPSIIDHEWLASNPVPAEDLRTRDMVIQDLMDGLSRHPSSAKLKDLSERWFENRTTGLEIVPNRSREVKPVPKNDTSVLPQDKVDNGVLFRRVAYGERLSDILKDTNDTGLKARLASEYGLLGRVYVKEEYFPGIFNGRWDEVVRKRCASAMYLVPRNSDCSIERHLGMKVSQEIDIPWGNVSKSVLPKLDVLGVKISSSANKREIIRKAFIDLIEGSVKSLPRLETWYQTHKDHSEDLSFEEARDILRDSEPEQFLIFTPDETNMVRLSNKLEKLAHDLIKGGFLEGEIVNDVIRDTRRTPEQRIARLYELSAQPRAVSKYAGLGTEVKEHIQHRSKVEFTDKDRLIREKKDFDRRVKQAQSKAAKIVSSGLLTIDEADKATRGHKSPEAKLEAMYKAAARKGYDVSVYKGDVDNSDARMSVNELSRIQETAFNKQANQSKAEYQRNVLEEINRLVTAGVVTKTQFEKVLKDHGTLEARLSEISRLAAGPTRNIQTEAPSAHYMDRNASSARVSSEMKVAQWLKQKMSEGSAGEELDSLIEARFSTQTLDSHGSLIERLRGEHEGLSGHLYVDVSAYATEGMEGCDKGSLLHRQNGIPSALMTDKCRSCVFNTEGMCQKYNKALISHPSEISEDVSRYQADMIRLANSSDSERTASLFVNEYDQGEYALSSDDGIISFEETAAEEKLGEVLFGGFEV